MGPPAPVNSTHRPHAMTDRRAHVPTFTSCPIIVLLLCSKELLLFSSSLSRACTPVLCPRRSRMPTIFCFLHFALTSTVTKLTPVTRHMLQIVNRQRRRNCHPSYTMNSFASISNVLVQIATSLSTAESDRGGWLRLSRSAHKVAAYEVPSTVSATTDPRIVIKSSETAFRGNATLCV